MELNVDFNEFKNIIMNHDFTLSSLKGKLKKFKFIDKIEDVYPDLTECTPANVLSYAIEDAIYSLDTDANSGWATNNAGHLWALTGNIPNPIAGNRPLPILLIWVDNTTHIIYEAMYWGSNSYKWCVISNDFTTSWTEISTVTGISFKYRILNGKIVEWFLQNSTGDLYTNVTQIATLPFTISEYVYSYLVIWSASSSESSNNVLRITPSGAVELIANQGYVRGSGMFILD